MLRCAGCGGLVSAFAARCPGCGHPTDDAAGVAPEPGRERDAPLALIPLDEAEPPAARVPRPRLPVKRRRPRRLPSRRVAIAVAAVAVAGAAALGTGALSTSSRAPGPPFVPAAAPALGGRVVVETGPGVVFFSRPDGTHRRAIRLQTSGPAGRPLWVEDNGVVVSRTADGFVEGDHPLVEMWPPGAAQVDAAPFADGNDAVVVMTGAVGPGFSSGVFVVSLADNRAVGLGSANDAAGDPQATGAFVADAAPGGAPPGGGGGLADAQVELRDSGRPPVVLATAAQLIRAAHGDPGRPVNLTVFPDHAGDKIAVLLNPVDGSDANSALVVVGRDGSVLGAVGRAEGPTARTTPWWSPDDTSLAYPTFGTVGTAVAVVDRTYRVAVQPLQPTSRIEGCTWSPDSAWALCLVVSQFTENWLLARNDGALAPIFSLPAGGVPVAWLP